jgi:hypothetical protein
MTKLHFGERSGDEAGSAPSGFPDLNRIATKEN